MFSFVKSRPPLVLFFLCILTLAVTFFCYAFYIRNTDLIPDTDRKYDWFQLIKHFNNLDVCLELNDSSKLKEDSDDSIIETVSVQTLVTINNTEFIREFTSVRGTLSLDDWHSDCPKNYPKPSSLQIYFDIPEVASNVTKFEICVTIKGPEEYLPTFSEPNCKIPNDTRSKKLEAFLYTTRNKNDKSFCRDGALNKLEFKQQVKDNFANFLSDKEKGLIYVHLLWTSYFLVFVLLLIIIYGISNGIIFGGRK